MPKLHIGTAAISNRNDLKPQSASQIATKIASESLEKRVEIASETAMIRSASEFKFTRRLDLKSLAIWASKHLSFCGKHHDDGSLHPSFFGDGLFAAHEHASDVHLGTCGSQSHKGTDHWLNLADLCCSS